jgi:16S rRNA (adenine1518-N6/adenine1519-N6)-dimethyltransferase
VIEIESVTYLDENYPKLEDKIISKRFWDTILMKFWKTVRYYGNFPYNISTQIFEH